MKRPVRIAAWGALGLGAFALFLYWSFPYDLVKDRLIAGIERQLGGGIEVRIAELGPSWFTGVKLKGVALLLRGPDGVRPLWRADRAKIRIGLFSLLLGRPKARVTIRGDRSRLHGVFQRLENGFQLEAEASPLALGEVEYLQSALGIRLDGTIEGKVRLQMNPAQVTQGQGMIELAFKDWRVRRGSKLPVAEGETVEVKEDLWATRGSDSLLKVQLANGTAEIVACKLMRGDFDLDVKGQVFLAPRLGNSRYNVTGQLKTTPKVEQVPPFLYFQEQWKDPDGAYPVAITGNFRGKPQIRIKDYLVPL